MVARLFRQIGSFLSCKNTFLRRTVFSWFNLFYSDLDGLREVAVERGVNGDLPTFPAIHHRMNFRYLAQFLSCLLFLLDLLLAYSASGWQFTSIPPGGTLGRHLMPPSFGHRADIFWLNIDGMLACVTGLFLFHNMTSFEEKWRMSAHLQPDGTLRGVTQNGRTLEKDEGEALYALHRKAKRSIEIVCLSFINQVQGFYLLNIYIQWNNRFRDYLALGWAIAIVPYLVLHFNMSIYSFILNCRYIVIKQRRLLADLHHLSVHLTRQQQPQTPYQSLAQFQCIHRQFDRLQQEILGYSHFWSRYLSVFFAFIMFIVTYFAYLFTQPANRQSVANVAFILFFGFQMLSILLWITLECSAVHRKNIKLIDGQRNLVMTLKRKWKMKRSILLKFDQMEADRAFIGEIGFKLFESIQINSKMFELLLVYTSTLFMKIIKSGH